VCYRNELPVARKIDQIAQAIDEYQKENENLCEHLTPTTPPAMKEQRKQEEIVQVQEMEQQVSTVVKLLDKAAQIWTRLEENPHVQRWDKEEERINAMIQELKQRHKTIPIPERVKGTQDIKNMQVELITTQTQKQERRAQIEPLQEWVAEIIAQAKGDRT
jgi:cell division FtsZ-interacting protein ZapD